MELAESAATHLVPQLAQHLQRTLLSSDGSPQPHRVASKCGLLRQGRQAGRGRRAGAGGTSDGEARRSKFGHAELVARLHRVEVGQGCQRCALAPSLNPGWLAGWLTARCSLASALSAPASLVCASCSLCMWPRAALTLSILRCRQAGRQAGGQAGRWQAGGATGQRQCAETRGRRIGADQAGTG